MKLGNNVHAENKFAVIANSRMVALDRTFSYIDILIRKMFEPTLHFIEKVLVENDSIWGGMAIIRNNPWKWPYGSN